VIKPDDLVKKYLGIPYKLRGRNPEEGFDCWGLVLWLFKNEFGIKLFDLENLEYEKDWYREGNYFLENVWRDWEKLEKPELYCGVMFNSLFGFTNHGGIMLDSNRFLHCALQGVVVSRISDRQHQEAFNGFYRNIKLAEKLNDNR
jgi:cell wall-associated NlpC family hydrolase